MITPAHYPHAYTYLATHMQRISRGFVILGLALVLWVILGFAAVGIWNFALQVLT